MAERTPEQWLKVMLEDLTAQHRVVNVMEAWYQGRHPLPAASATNSDLYRKFQKMAQSNLLTQVVDAVGSRLSVEGIGDGEKERGHEHREEPPRPADQDEGENRSSELFPPLFHRVGL